MIGPSTFDVDLPPGDAHRLLGVRRQGHHPGVAHEHVDGAEGGLGALEVGGVGQLVGDIEDGVERARQLRRGARELGTVDVADRDLGAGGVAGLGGGQTDPASGTGDHDDATGEGRG